MSEKKTYTFFMVVNGVEKAIGYRAAFGRAPWRAHTQSIPEDKAEFCQKHARCVKLPWPSLDNDAEATLIAEDGDGNRINLGTYTTTFEVKEPNKRQFLNTVKDLARELPPAFRKVAYKIGRSTYFWCDCTHGESDYWAAIKEVAEYLGDIKKAIENPMVGHIPPDSQLKSFHANQDD